MRVARMPPASSPIPGAAISSGSTPSTPRAFAVSGDPYRRSCQSPIAARATRTTSTPSRCGSVRPTWRERRARTPAGLPPASTDGIVRATTQAAAASAATIRASSSTVAVLAIPASASGPNVPSAWTTPTARYGAIRAAGIAIISASPNAIAERWLVPAPRDRSSATSTRRRSISIPATRRIA